MDAQKLGSLDHGNYYSHLADCGRDQPGCDSNQYQSVYTVTEPFEDWIVFTRALVLMDTRRPRSIQGAQHPGGMKRIMIRAVSTNRFLRGMYGAAGINEFGLSWRAFARLFWVFTGGQDARRPIWGIFSEMRGD